MKNPNKYGLTPAVVILYFFTLGLFIFGLWRVDTFSQQRANEIVSEQRIRIDQNCQIFEKQHIRDVNQLISTYRYLETLKPEEKRGALYDAIKRGLDRAEATAVEDVPPKYCLEPGIGLDSPLPKIPPRPNGV